MNQNSSATIISQLKKLNIIDADYYQKLAERKQYEDQFNSQSAVLAKVTSAYKEFVNNIKAKELSYKSQERFYKEEQQKLVDRRKSLATLNDYKLQEKASKEIDQALRQLNAQEDQLISQLDYLEQQKSTIEEREKQLADEQASFDELQATVNAKSEELGSQIKELETEREKILGALHPKDANIYKRLASKHPGKVVVPIKGNSCSGCFNTLHPQLLLKLSREQELVSCPSCGRILFMDNSPKEEEGTAAAE